MTHPSSFQPPRVVVWLLDLFTPYEQTESIPGDLLEEFADVASKSGVAYARRWYWRQSLRTILHLTISGFRLAPWSMAGVVIGGVLLVQLGHPLAEWAVRGWTEFLNHQVFPYHRLPRFEVYLFNSGIYLCRLITSMLIGCVIALACKTREMLATVTVSLLCSIQAVAGFWTFVRGWKDFATLRTVLLPVLLYFFGGLLAIVIGGVVVRRSRFRSPRPAGS